MSARDQILAAVRRAAAPAAELPAAWPKAQGAAPSEAELVRRFCAMLEEVGGTAIEMEGVAAISFNLPEVASGRRGIVSSVPGLAISTLTLGAEPSRERLDGIELAVIPGRFGVAENAAVWVDEADLPHRAVPFVAQHLAIVLPRREIVADMHAAYRRLPLALPGYGVFISGPSKTADIEQALVIGAQGPKSLVVFLV